MNESLLNRIIHGKSEVEECVMKSTESKNRLEERSSLYENKVLGEYLYLVAVFSF